MGETNVILRRAISKLRQEYIHQLPISPSFFAKGVIGVMVRLHSAQTTFEIIRCRRIACCSSGLRSLLYYLFRSGVDRSLRHAGRQSRGQDGVINNYFLFFSMKN